MNKFLFVGGSEKDLTVKAFMDMTVRICHDGNSIRIEFVQSIGQLRQTFLDLRNRERSPETEFVRASSLEVGRELIVSPRQVSPQR